MTKRIAELTAGETVVECRFQVRRAHVAQAKTGPYLCLILGDETGTIKAVRWKATEAEQAHALAAQAVFLSGRVRSQPGYAAELVITSFECLPSAGTAVAAPKAVFQTLAYEAELARQLQRIAHVAAFLLGEDATVLRHELFETELRRAFDRMYTLGQKGTQSAAPGRPYAVPVRRSSFDADDLDDPFADN